MTSYISIEDVHLGFQEVDVNSVRVLFVDIDGTVADGSHRIHFINTKPKNWPAYEKSQHLDTPIQWVIDIVNEFYNKGTTVVFVSGRSDRNKQKTVDWLAKHKVQYGLLRMRKDGDYRSDDIVKKEILDELTTMGLYPDLVLDDRDRVVAMWRENNIKVIQVAEGDF